MLEILSLFWQMDELLRRGGFIVVGSNDLFQLIFADDCGSGRGTVRYDPLSAPFMRVLKSIAQSCTEADVLLAVWGEMAGRPLDVLALVGLGCRRLSMSAASIDPVKETIMSKSCYRITEFIDNVWKLKGNRAQPALVGYARGIKFGSNVVRLLLSLCH